MFRSRAIRRRASSARAAIAEPAGDENAVGLVEQLLAARLLQRLPSTHRMFTRTVLEAAVVERFVEALSANS